jgi:hypothetical protein
MKVGATLTFDAVDVVDVHDAAGSRERRSGRMSFHVTDVTCDPGVTIAVGEWKTMGELDAPDMLPTVWKLASSTLREDVEELGWTESELRLARGVVCRTTNDSGPYGPSRRRLCLDRNGLASLDEVNRSGPRLRRSSGLLRS